MRIEVRSGTGGRRGSKAVASAAHSAVYGSVRFGLLEQQP
jgi:hypothetical protein